MGTRYSAEFYGTRPERLLPFQTNLQLAVDRVDAQMFLWISNSALNR